jgi:hypothetical protein
LLLCSSSSLLLLCSSSSIARYVSTRARRKRLIVWRIDIFVRDCSCKGGIGDIAGNRTQYENYRKSDFSGFTHNRYSLANVPLIIPSRSKLYSKMLCHLLRDDTTKNGQLQELQQKIFNSYSRHQQAGDIS